MGGSCFSAQSLGLGGQERGEPPAPPARPSGRGCEGLLGAAGFQGDHIGVPSDRRLFLWHLLTAFLWRKLSLQFYIC